MESACTACSDDNSLCTGNHDLLGLHIHKNSTGCLALIVENDLNCGCEINNGDLTVENLVTESLHYLSAGVVLTSVHSLSGCTAAVSCNHCAVGHLVELNAQLIEPLDSVGSVVNELVNQLMLALEVTAAVSVDIVDSRGVVGLVGSLNTAFSHHSVSVTDTELCNDHYVCAAIVSLDSCGRACSAAADNENVNIVLGIFKVDLCGIDTAVSLKESSKLVGNLFALVRTDLELLEL